MKSVTNFFIVLTLLRFVININGDDSSKYKFIKKIYDQCVNNTETIKCLKIQALKVVDNAMKAKNLEIFGGLNIVRENNLRDVNRTGRMLHNFLLNEDYLKTIKEDKLDQILYDYAGNFLNTHIFQVNVPKIVEEARRRRKRDRMTGPLIAALALKGVVMAMAYKSIAVMAGTALIIGKMALVLAAVLGLKKLVSQEKEKTTFEIVKTPSHSNTHTYSSSYDEGEGHYHRSLTSGEDAHMLEKIYRSIYQ